MTKNATTKKTLEAWLLDRVPEIPAPFLPFLLDDGDDLFSPEVLVQRGEKALNRALQESGKGREAAYHLLAADAFLTYACEVAVEAAADEGPGGEVTATENAVDEGPRAGTPEGGEIPRQLEGLLTRLGERFG